MSPPPGEFDERAPTFQVGDVVYVEGASAIIGDVTAVDEDGVTIAWRPTTTTEQPEDLCHEAWGLEHPRSAPVTSAGFDAAFEKWATAIGLPEAAHWNVKAEADDSWEIEVFADSDHDYRLYRIGAGTGESGYDLLREGVSA